MASGQVTLHAISALRWPQYFSARLSYKYLPHRHSFTPTPTDHPTISRWPTRRSVTPAAPQTWPPTSVWPQRLPTVLFIAGTTSFLLVLVHHSSLWLLAMVLWPGQVLYLRATTS